MKRLVIWGAVALVLLAMAAAGWDGMPDRVAVHWDLSGEPDGSLPKAAALAIPLVLWAVAALSGLREGPAAAGLGVLALLLQGLTIWTNLDRAGWRDARHLPVWVPLLLIGLTMLAGWAGARLTGRGAATGTAARALDLRRGERAVWVSRCTNPLLLTLGYLALAGGVVVLLIGGAGGTPWPVLLLIGAVGVLLSTIRVQVSERGVAVAYGPWSFPVWRKGLTEIAAARTEDLRPLQVGGWGLRGLPGRATLMLRGGECLVLDYPGGGRFAISVDDAEQGAALINALKAAA